MDIIKKIEESYSEMTKKQKVIADFMLQNTDTLTFISLRELSQQTGVTEVTILNMCKMLGFNSFNEVKYEFRKLLGNGERQQFYEGNEYYQIDIPEYELSDEEKFFQELRQEELQLVVDTFREMDTKKMLEVAENIVDAQKVVICGRGISYLLTDFLATGLAGGEIGSIKVNTELNENVFATLPLIDKHTVVVAFSFPDYYFATDKFAGYAKELGAKVIVITDSENAAICSHADRLILVKSNTRLALNTLSSPTAVVNLLISAVRIVGKNKKRRKVREEFGKFSK